MKKLSTIFALSLISLSAMGSLGNLVSNQEIPVTACLAEFSSGDEVYHCSGAMVDATTFKTAAHCLKEATEIEVRCQSGFSSQVIKEIGHEKFSKKAIKRDLYQRRYDHAFLKLEKPFEGAVQPLLMQEKIIEGLLKESRECAFFGVGLNPWYQGTGKLHGVRTDTQKINLENGLLIVNDPFGAVTMIGDSGASFFCRNESMAWVNIGTVSAHSWDNETIVALNSIMLEDKRFVVDAREVVKKNNSAPLAELTSVEVSKTYRVLPFSSYTSDESGEEFNSVDRLHARFIVEKVEGEFATGRLEHYGPAKYYLCFDGISCEEKLENIRIHRSRLVENYNLPKFLSL
ncbi:trypsin-like serine protease [Bacteriovorax sp. DB6_IX]|uniref:trypsin-like serine protease n=1 Tax=Bacteriovorax sp. DB6_IX TaxID=1353530 RepID=UPI00038A47DC|nr:trypsin-like serine protease [Bacteriovorax sp. DB6_IX]EQC51406.1 trypsin [Bacteriovorax sp. DB6_IX]